MIKNWKRIVMTVVFSVMACLLLPLAASASTVAITGFSAPNTTINAGNSVSISVTTNAAASHVFTMVDGTRVRPASQTQDASGDITWNLVCSPSRTQELRIYANTSDSTEGARTISIQVTVNPPSAGTGTGTGTAGGQAAAGVAITSIVETRGSTSDVAVLTVETTTSVNEVWVQFNADRFSRARLATETADTKTWTLSIRPTAPQNVIVSANTAYVVRGAATQEFSVTMQGGRPAGGVATITNARANRTTVAPGGNVDLTITTNLNATDVWVAVDGRNVDATRTNETRTAQTWTARINPAATQTITIYANSSDSLEGAVSRTLRITVQTAPVTGNATIVDATATADWTFWQNTQGNVTVNVTTNNWATYVRAETGAGVFDLWQTNHGTTGNKTWTANIPFWQANLGSTITVRTGQNSGVTDATRTVSINNWNQGQGFVTVTRSVDILTGVATVNASMSIPHNVGVFTATISGPGLAGNVGMHNTSSGGTWLSATYSGVLQSNNFYLVIFYINGVPVGQGNVQI
jgi:hypothetical protein